MKKIGLIISIVFGIMILCVAALLCANFYSGRQLHFPSTVIPASRSQDYSAEAEESQTFNVASPVTMKVENFAGNVQIKKGPAGTIVIQAKKTAHGVSQEAAKENLERLTIETGQTAETVWINVKVNSNNGNDWGGSVDFVISLPEKTAVQVTVQSGDLALSSIHGDIELNTDYGSIEVSEVSGGPLSAVTRSGLLSVKNIQVGDSHVNLRGDFRDISIEQLTAGSLTVESKNGAVRLSEVHVSGQIDISSEFGTVAFLGGSGNRLLVETKNGDVWLADLSISENLVVSSQFRDIRLDKVAAQSYELSTKNGRVDVEEASGLIRALSDFGDIDIRGARAATVDLKSKNGQVNFEGHLSDGPHQVHSDFGHVLLRLSADTALDVDLSTNFGVISSEMDVTPQNQPDEKHWFGTINGGGAALTVSTKNGNITLEIKQ